MTGAPDPRWGGWGPPVPPPALPDDDGPAAVVAAGRPSWASAPPSPAPAPAPISAGLHGHWQRLHPLSAIVRASRGLVAVVLVFVADPGAKSNDGAPYVHLVVLALALLSGLVIWLVTRWRVADGVLQVETGLLRRRSFRYPLAQLQAVDIVRPGLARVLGMAELRLRMAGGGRDTGRLSYLHGAAAEQLRAALLDHANASVTAAEVVPLAGTVPGTPPEPFGAPPGAVVGVPLHPAPGVLAGGVAPRGGSADRTEHLLYRVDPRRLVGSLLLSAPALVLAATVLALVASAAVAPAATSGAASASVVLLLGTAGGLWRRFNAFYQQTVSSAADGLRLRSGLVETSAETIPAGRVQALRLVQPVTWRPFGWYRLEVEVAGRGVSGRQNRSARRAARTLVPVGTFQQVNDLVERVLPGRPVELHRPPRRVRWKSPLRYRRLAFAWNDGYVASATGRVRRVQEWVPLGRVQSVRWVQGPLQRRLSLATVHVDIAGRAVPAARDRDAGEATALIEGLPAACREARLAGR